MNDSDRSRKGEDWVPIAAVPKKGCEPDSGRITRYRLTSRARTVSYTHLTLPTKRIV